MTQYAVPSYSKPRGGNRDKIDNPEAVITYAEWCRDRGFDPVTREYERDES